MRVSDFSVPRRMSGSAYWVLMAKELREFAFIDWYFKKYYIEGGKLVFMNGLLNKGITSIPLSKVQSMRTKQGFIYRVLELRGVLFDTLASKSAEIELILDDRDWKALMERVEMEEAAVEDKDSGADAGDVQGVPAGEAVDKDMAMEGNPEEKSAAGNAVRMSFSNSNLIKGAFCQNHLQGMAVLFAALAAYISGQRTHGRPPGPYHAEGGLHRNPQRQICGHSELRQIQQHRGRPSESHLLHPPKPAGTGGPGDLRTAGK